MKRFFAVIFAAFITAAVLGSCSAQRVESGRLTVVTTIFPQYDFARTIAGGRADVKMLLPPGSEAHYYEPTLEDLAAINSCGLFIAAGGGIDAWCEKVISLCENDIRVLKLTDCVPLLEEAETEGMQEEHGHGHAHAEPETDEHVWTSPRNAAAIAARIAEEMSAADPLNADYYMNNADVLIRELGVLDADFRDTAEKARVKTLIFAERFPFRYFAAEYGFDYYAAFNGCSADNEVKLETVAFFIQKIKELDIRAVFYVEFSNEAVADVICGATGCRKLLFHSCHTVSKDDLAAGKTYISIMRENLENLKKAVS